MELPLPAARPDPVDSTNKQPTNEQPTNKQPTNEDRKTRTEETNDHKVAADTASGRDVRPASQQIQDQIDSDYQKTFGVIRLSAQLFENGPILETGIVWRIFSKYPDENGNFKVIARSEEATPLFQLIATDYVVNVAYGRANATKEISLPGGKTYHDTVILNAGGLRLTSVLPDGGVIPDHDVTYNIYAAEQDSTGQHKLIFPSASSGRIIRLNAGNYHVVGQYGDANAMVQANVAVQAGRLSEAVVHHSAAEITFKLVHQLGGEALANTFWSIFTPDGEMISESIGAFPSHILADGDYNVIARHEGRSYNKSFTVRAGFNQEVELLTDIIQDDTKN